MTPYRAGAVLKGQGQQSTNFKGYAVRSKIANFKGLKNNGIYSILYMCVCVQKKIVIELTTDLIYLRTDFFPK